MENLAVLVYYTKMYNQSVVEPKQASFIDVPGVGNLKLKFASIALKFLEICRILEKRTKKLLIRMFGLS